MHIIYCTFSLHISCWRYVANNDMKRNRIGRTQHSCAHEIKSRELNLLRTVSPYSLYSTYIATTNTETILVEPSKRIPKAWNSIPLNENTSLPALWKLMLLRIQNNSLISSYSVWDPAFSFPDRRRTSRRSMTWSWPRPPSSWSTTATPQWRSPASGRGASGTPSI